MKKIFCFLLGFCFFVGCQSTKDAFTLKKKNNSDEFLVEKKSPLVLPPSYGELPKPQNKQTDSKIEKNSDIQITLGEDQIKMNKIIKNSNPSNLEKSVLKKIK